MNKGCLNYQSGEPLLNCSLIYPPCMLCLLRCFGFSQILFLSPANNRSEDIESGFSWEGEDQGSTTFPFWPHPHLQFPVPMTNARPGSTARPWSQQLGCTVESRLLEGEDKARFWEYYHPHGAQIVIDFSSGPPPALNDSTRIKGTLTHLSMWLSQALSFSHIPPAFLKL